MPLYYLPCVLHASATSAFLNLSLNSLVKSTNYGTPPKYVTFSTLLLPLPPNVLLSTMFSRAVIYILTVPYRCYKIPTAFYHYYPSMFKTKALRR
jgi:hypothetical protein